ncbi:hypothetical protein K469DRAFT_702714 [Zopfia rhizophila CBS 207.26]|uniref:SRR1-like domain-containing protein n=1 Tax=Zopfia rhizophila CBS 207.26 TaxID=1314779 RepID=A0A6A6EEH3_9PEZI|nr:hypothetical protein K469DRAFT_702714 [Zopfia rhizophila CBS 207.26]
MFLQIREGAVQIKKIVCTGLRSPRYKYTSATLHHLSTFTIAQTLSNLCCSADPKTPQIQIVAQDPDYTVRDELLPRSIEPCITFVEDPQGFLDIDESTFVITAFLPFCVPPHLIVADTFHSRDGPAEFLCDKTRT